MTVQTQTQRVDNEIVLLDMINSRGKFTNIKSAEKFLKKSLRKVKSLEKKVVVTPENIINQLGAEYISRQTLREVQTFFGKRYIQIKDLMSIDKSKWMHLGLSYEGYIQINKLRKLA